MWVISYPLLRSRPLQVQYGFGLIGMFWLGMFLASAVSNDLAWLIAFVAIWFHCVCFVWFAF
jgi:hypothetical protein